MNLTSEDSTRTDLLLSAFDSFNRVSTALESAYAELQERVDVLSSQLEQNNYFLRTVLESLPCGVLVVDANGLVRSVNPMVRELFDAGDLEVPFPLVELFGTASFSDRAEVLMAEGGTATEITLSGDIEKTLHCCWSGLHQGEKVLVVQDMTRIRLLEKQMREAERIAAMGEMAMEVAHEIRNPLGALELFATLLGEEGLSAEERLQYAGNVQVGIRSLNTVLNNMLCVRRTPTPQLVSASLGEILESVSDLMSPLLAQRGITVKLDRWDSTTVLVDPEMVRQILTNLVTNSMQALPEGGKLHLRTLEDVHSVSAEVEDTGVGIPKQLQRLIFDSGFSASKGGAGLGLAIVRRLLDALDGCITVESEEGKGTRFRVSFPRESKDDEGSPGC